MKYEWVEIHATPGGVFLKQRDKIQSLEDKINKLVEALRYIEAVSSEVYTSHRIFEVIYKEGI